MYNNTVYSFMQEYCRPQITAVNNKKPTKNCYSGRYIFSYGGITVLLHLCQNPTPIVAADPDDKQKGY